MALAAFLSAMRQIILDLDVIPKTEAERLSLYGSKFPALSSFEVEDLAKIPADKFSTYTSTIYNGERSTLEGHFPITFALLRLYWPKHFKKPLDALRLTKDLHHARPWKSNSSFTLAENFRAYLEHELAPFTEKLPVIAEAARFEYLSLLVKRDPDDTVMRKDAQSASELGALTVDKLLNLGFFLVPSARFERFGYDLPGLKQKLPDTITDSEDSSLKPKIIFAAAGRNRENYTRWTLLDEGVWDYLKTRHQASASAARTPEKITAISALAEVFVGAQPDEDTNEEDLFRKFFDCLIGLIEGGLIILPAPSVMR